MQAQLAEARKHRAFENVDDIIVQVEHYESLVPPRGRSKGEPELECTPKVNPKVTWKTRLKKVM